MKTLKHVRPFLLAIVLAASSIGQAQVTVPTNNCNASDWVGTDNTSPFPLRIMQNDNWPIDWYTNATQRMRLYPDQVGNIPLFTGGTVPVQQNGFLGLSGTPAFFAPGSYGPFTRLHLVDESPAGSGIFYYAQPWSYRTWMRNGITFTGNRDHSYVGPLYFDEDETDMVVQWGDNSDKQTQGSDRMRFLFTWYRLASETEGSQSEEGLEFMRMYPLDRYEGFVGVGNYARPGLTEPEPTERLDLLDRTIRLRDFGPVGNTTYLNQNTNVNRVLVADEDDGVVYWRPITDFTGQTDCDWTIQNAGISGTSTSHQVYTAAGSSLSCPDTEDEVGIGTTTPTAKLTLIDSRTVGGAALKVEKDNTTVMATKVGMDLDCHGGSSTNTGISVKTGLGAGIGSTSAINWGVDLESTINGTVDKNYGMEVYAYNSSSGTADQGYGLYVRSQHDGSSNYGIYTTAQGNVAGGGNAAWNYGIWANASGGTAPNNWAGWFNGKVWITGDGYVNGGWAITSDMNLKTNVADLQAASDVIAQLAPKTYEFIQNANPNLDLASGVQAGFLAQEVEQIVPQLVKDVALPPVLDSLGNVTTPSETIKTLNYTGLIPYMVAAIQEQQVQIHQLQQDLASCCTPDGTGLDMRSGEYDGFTNASSLENDRLTIAPNPFQERTTLSYLLEAVARVRLQVHTEGGMHLVTLRDQPQEPGSYSMTWDTQDLAPGLYYVTLFADGKPVVKKAVKVR